MAPCTCPNTECEYDKQLELGEECPFCGETAENFNFQDFGSLLKEKQDFKRASNKNKMKHTHNRNQIKFCPKCGSPNVHFIIYYRPSIWRCSNCGYEGVFVVEGSEFANQIHERHKKRVKKQVNLS